MQKSTLVQFIITIVVFVALILAAVIIIYIKTKNKKSEDAAYNFVDNIRDSDYYDEKLPFINIEDFITDKNDPVPDINRALAKTNNVFFPKGFDLPLNKPIIVPSNTIIRFEEDMKISSTKPVGNCLFLLLGVTGVKIFGNNLEIYNSPSICIMGSSDITIENMKLINPVGDGILISGCDDSSCNSFSEGISLNNIQIEAPQKTGLLISSVKSLWAGDITIKDSYTNSGIEILAENANSILEDIYFEKITTQKSRLRITSKTEKSYAKISNYNTDTEILIKDVEKLSEFIFKDVTLKLNNNDTKKIQLWHAHDSTVDFIGENTNESNGFIYNVEPEQDEVKLSED